MITNSFPARRWTGVYLTVYSLYILAGMAVRIGGWMHDDALVYTQSARRVLDGSFNIYGILRNPEIAPPLGVTYAYSSFMTILIAPFVGIADWFKLGNIWAMRLIALPLLVADVLAMQQLRYLARSLRPRVEERFLFVGILLSLFITGFLLVTAYKSHIEGTVLLFILLALRYLPRNILLSGVFAGLALSAKHMTALLGLVPIGVALLFYSRYGARGGLRATLTWLGTSLAVFGGFLLPPILYNPGAAYYALVTQANRIGYVGPGLPRWAINWLSANLISNDYLIAREFVLQYSSVFLVLVVGLVSLFVVWRQQVRGAPVSFDDTRLLGLVAFGSVAYILLAKWVSDSYFQLPLALVFLWDVARKTPVARNVKAARFASVPWVGIGAAVAYQSINLLDPGAFTNMAQATAPWHMDALLFALFAAISIMILRDLLRHPQPSQA